MTNSVLAVSVARSDFGILTPVLAAIRAHPALELRVAATGMHLVPEFGMTVNEMKDAGFAPDITVPTLDTDDSPAGTARAIAKGVAGFGDVFAGDPVDILLLLGDRFEMFAAAVAAVPFPIAIAHIHGGELSFGAIDEQMRHAITKLSHMHFPATARARRRLMDMGEQPERIVLAGAPALDIARGHDRDPDRALQRLSDRIGTRLSSTPVLVTFHPVTRDADAEMSRLPCLLDAIATIEGPVLMTAPNADAAGRSLLKAYEQFAASRDNIHLVLNLGQSTYFDALAASRAMIGNSSSGIIEAATFGLPVVNVGARQEGRETSANVIHTSLEAVPLKAAIRKALSPEFRSECSTTKNVYDQGDAAGRIAAALADVRVDAPFLVKRFNDRTAA